MTGTEIRGVLLDLDGTLVDHDTAADRALLEWLPTLGVRPTDELLRLWHVVCERHLAVWREGRITFAEQRRRRLRDFLPTVGVPVVDDDRRLDALFEGYRERYERGCRAFDDVDGTLAALARAGIATAVLTNGAVDQQRRKLVRSGLEGRVGPVYTAEELGVAKPAAGAFLDACDRWGVPPRAVVSVGDRHDLDVRAARDAGLAAVHLDRYGAGPLDEPHRISSLWELPGALGVT